MGITSMLFSPKTKRGTHSQRMAAQDAGDDYDRDLLRCSNLEELWRAGRRKRTEEEAILWTRLNCDSVLKGNKARESEDRFHGVEDHDNREKSEKVPSFLLYGVYSP
jgi:hypothetical protein